MPRAAPSGRGVAALNESLSSAVATDEDFRSARAVDSGVTLADTQCCQSNKAAFGAAVLTALAVVGAQYWFLNDGTELFPNGPDSGSGDGFFD